LQNLDIHVASGTLVIACGQSDNHKMRICIFCSTHPVRVHITAPYSTSVSAENAVRFSGTVNASDTLSLALRNGVWSDISLAGTSIRSLTANAQNGVFLRIGGVAETARLSA
jgi:hypothetical protein